MLHTRPKVATTSAHFRANFCCGIRYPDITAAGVKLEREILVRCSQTAGREVPSPMILVGDNFLECPAASSESPKLWREVFLFYVPLYDAASC